MHRVVYSLRCLKDTTRKATTMNVKLTETHCSNCGSDYDPFATHDGYTGCCNEPVCRGTEGILGRSYQWACKNPADIAGWPTIIDNVHACCGAGADLAAEAKGVAVAWRIS